MSRKSSQATVDKAGDHKPRKAYEIISATFNGNKVKIRVPKSTAKPPKLTPSQLKLQQQCTCDDGESVCSNTCGRHGGKTGNKLTFQIPDDLCEALTHRTLLNSEITCSKKEKHDIMCTACQNEKSNPGGGMEVKKSSNANKDVYVLKLGNQTDEPARDGNIEVELVTPRVPALPKPPGHSCKYIQCDGDELPCCVPCRTCKPSVKKKPRRVKCCR